MRVIPLVEFPPSQLELVLADETQQWASQLHWDFSSAARLIADYLKKGRLGGWALTDSAGTPIGYSYYVSDGEVGYIGDLYIRSEWSSIENYALLLSPTVEALRRPRIDRIECQVFPFHRSLKPLFVARGFDAIRRHFLCCRLDEASEIAAPPLAPNLRISHWQPDRFADVAEAICDSYIDSGDFHLCRDYQSVAGCTRFLRNVVLSSGCGTFSSGLSRIALTDSGQVAAVLIASRIGPGTGMIPQLSVRRKWQRRGVGAALLASYLVGAAEDGLQRAALSVSVPNRPAYRLYERFGFRQAKSFHAFVRQNGSVSQPD